MGGKEGKQSKVLLWYMLVLSNNLSRKMFKELTGCRSLEFRGRFGTTDI